MARKASQRLVLKQIFIISYCFPDRSSHPVCPNDRQEIEEEGGVSTLPLEITFKLETYILLYEMMCRTHS